MVFMKVGAQLLNLLDWYAYSGGPPSSTLIRGYVFIWKSSKTANFNFSSAHSTLRVNDDCDPRSLFLEHWLGGHIYAREPTAVARMRVVPAHEVLGSVDLLRVLQMSDHVFVGVGASVYSGLCGFTGESEGVGDVEGVALEAALKVAHDLDVATKLGVHDHFDKGGGRYLYFFEVKLTLNI